MGGFIYGLATVVDTGKDGQGVYQVLKGNSKGVFLLSKALVGLGGGLAALFAALSVGRYIEPPKNTDLLSLTALCFVAGYIGHRLLPAVAARLEREMGEVRRKAENAESKAEEVGKSVERNTGVLRDQIEMAREVGAAARELANRNASPTKIDNTINTLKFYREQFPLDRHLHLVLAKLYMSRKSDRHSAIKILEEFIAKKLSVGRKDNDVADAFFNIACYYSRILDSDSEDRTPWDQEGIKALKNSIAINPKNALDAQSDPDLERLREFKEVREIIASPELVDYQSLS